MVLYHGSNIDFEKLDLSKSKLGKDFGKGIYLTTNYNQAVKWATKKGSGFIYSYSFDETVLEKDGILSYKALTEYDAEWLELVTKCRYDLFEPEYDSIFDRMADNTYQKLNEYIFKYYRHIMSANRVIAGIRWNNIDYDQYCFKTEKALTYLTFIEKKEVKNEL